MIRLGLPLLVVDSTAFSRHSIWRRRIGVSAGASAPEVLVEEVIARLKDLGARNVRELSGSLETIVFPIPKELISVRQ